MEVRYYGFALHLSISESITIYKTAEACNKAVQIALSKGWSGYAANCEYIPNSNEPNGYEITEEWNKVSF